MFDWLTKRKIKRDKIQVFCISVNDCWIAFDNISLKYSKCVCVCGTYCGFLNEKKVTFCSHFLAFKNEMKHFILLDVWQFALFFLLFKDSHSGLYPKTCVATGLINNLMAMSSSSSSSSNCLPASSAFFRFFVY